MSAENADPAQVVNTDAQPAAQPEQNAEVTATPAETTTPEQPRSEGIMEKMGLSEDVKDALRQRQKPAEEPVEEGTEQADGTPAAEEPVEAAAEGSEAESEPDDGDEEAAEEQHHDPQKVIEAKQKRINRLTRQRRQAEERAHTAEEEAEQLKAERETWQTVTVAPTVADPLAHVTDQKGLETERANAKIIRDFCRKNRDGYTANQGTPNERFVPPEEIGTSLSYAEDCLSEYIPKKEEELRARPQFTDEARKIMPTMFDRGHADYQVAQQLARQVPGIANHPAREKMAAIYIEGLKSLAAKQQANGKAPNGSNDNPKLQVPPELVREHQNRGKVPLLRQNPPNRPNGSSAPAHAKAAETAMKTALATGDRDSITAAIRARRSAGQNGVGNPKDPALV